MGMFSWDCLACGFSLRDCKGCSVDNWMNKGVVLTRGGSRIIGGYNSYGNLGGTNLVEQIDNFGVYHHACWELVGKPEFTKPSYHARDQGFCHAMHGQPFPKPTHVWLEKCQVWHVLERAISGALARHYELKYEEGEALFATLPTEAQERCLAAHKLDEAERDTKYRSAMEAYYNAEDEQAKCPERPEKSESFTFEGVDYYASVLSVINRCAEDDELRKNRKCRL